MDKEQDLMNYLYTGLAGWFQRRGHKIIYRLAEKYRNKRVLELGCGNGKHLDYGGKYRKYTGIDKNEQHLIELANKHKVVVSLQSADSFSFNHKFSLILSIYSMEHFKNLNDVMVNIKRYLAVNGRVIIALPNENWFYRIGRYFTSRQYIQTKYHENYQRWLAVEHINSVKDIEQAVNKFFTTEKVIWLPFRIIKIIVLRHKRGRVYS